MVGMNHFVLPLIDRVLCCVLWCCVVMLCFGVEDCNNYKELSTESLWCCVVVLKTVIIIKNLAQSRLVSCHSFIIYTYIVGFLFIRFHMHFCPNSFLALYEPVGI